MHAKWKPAPAKYNPTTLVFFATLPVFIAEGAKMPGDKMNKYKRKWRELSDEHKQKISQSCAGRHKSDLHKQHISQSMKDYWETVEHRPDAESGHTTMNDYLGISNDD